MLGVSKIRGKNTQMVINITSTMLSYVVSLGISFLLTPYIVGKLGVSAYGFIGLSNSIIGYTVLLTVALNSMSGRFVTLSYHRGDYSVANEYVSSTFFSNLVLSVFIILIMGLMAFFLEDLINIPMDILGDVKFLFTLLFVNSAISLLTGIFNFSTFIKNRLDLSNMRTMVSNILRAVLLICLYGYFPAHLWYIGMVAIVCSIYVVLTNWYYFRVLTPELNISKCSFRIQKVIEMVKSGAWNLLNSLSTLLNQGFELLLANLFIGAYFMGVLSISKTLPLLILNFFCSIGNNFHPEFIKLYSEKNMDDLKKALIKSITVISSFAAIPISCVFAYGDIFYSVWLPAQDSNLLYNITFITMVGIMFTIPPQSLWYIFTMTNTVRRSSLNLIKYAVANFIIVLALMIFVDNDIQKIYLIVTVQALMYILRYTTFLPFYGAEVLGYGKYTLFWPAMRMIFFVVIITAISLVYKAQVVEAYDWISLIYATMFTSMTGILGIYVFLFNKQEREYVKNKLLRRD